MSVDIPGTLTEAEKNAVEKYRSDVKTAAASEVARKEAAAAAARQAEADAVAAAEAAKPRKAPGVPSRTGGYGKALVQALPPGGGYPGSATSDAVGPAADLPTGGGAAALAAPAAAPAAGDRVDPAGFDAYPPPADPPPHGVGGGTKRRSLDAMFASGVISGLEGGDDGVPVLPPRANRMSFSVPRDVYGDERAGKVAAPIVSEEMAGSNPNMKGLLVEVPYKRDVRTTSVNQRYLNTEQKFHAAFELMPHTAAFGKLKAGHVYRLPLKLINVSHLPQRFTLKEGASAALRAVYRPGMVAAGTSVPLELEVSSESAVEVRETLTILTEREEITLPVTASVLEPDAYAEYVAAYGRGERRPPGQAPPRLLATTARPADLEKVLAPRAGDNLGFTKGWAKPVKAPETRGEAPDFFGEPPSDED